MGLRRILPALAPVLALLAGWLLGSASPAGDPFPAGAAADGERVLEDARALVTATGRRPLGSEADRRAAAWTERRLAEEGLPSEAMHATVGEAAEAWAALGVPWKDTRLPPETPLFNRLVRFPLADQPPASLAGHVLVMGHIDSVPRAPGAEDDASGVAVCLDLCRFLREHPPRRKVTVAFTDGEERDLLGAAVIAGRMTPEEVAELSLAFAVEMSGWGDRPYLHWFANARLFDWQPPPPDQVLASILSSGTPDGSFGQADPWIGWLFPALRDHVAIPNDADHRPFDLLGRPAVMMTTSSLSAFYPWYHTGDDTPDRLSAATLGRSASALRSAIHALGSAPDLGTDAGAYGYPLAGAVIPVLWWRLALGLCALSFLLTGGLAPRAGAAGLFTLAVLSPPSLLAAGVAAPAAVLALFARALRNRMLKVLLGAAALLPLLAACGVYFLARAKFGTGTLLNLAPLETAALCVALLAVPAVARRSRPPGAGGARAGPVRPQAA